MYRNVLKPILDRSIASCALLVVSPLFIVITVVLFFNNKGSAFFVQKRPGKNGAIFNIIKFKTMNDKVCENGILLSDYERLTFIGKAIRKTSLDELPQLINVLKGEMSLIGPRPLLPEYLHLYNEEQKRRHDVKPGITGWAQVNGRNALSWDEKFRFDVEYVDKISPGLDAQIVWITLSKVVRRHGVNVNNYMTMDAFKGNAA
ncbi:sugar transferase [Chryseobacterium sp. MDT2-18]|uniref:sugar transferase n=1 Tax=Chryseobacterium sp. MDT2-18 TaxID=1259136 RepID=UPI002787EB6E|nr:sugar transferase [Chryseobacterium sp. MDT2-18]MDQ0476853.1 lipopolysaccharide/colanic/teichoic acid biosynthesis glycosyltransferase [Chryseobacterium sp. MDT2-18]